MSDFFVDLHHLAHSPAPSNGRPAMTRLLAIALFVFERPSPAIAYDTAPTLRIRRHGR